MSVPIDVLKNRLNFALNTQNMKPIELSEKTNIPKSSISQYMSGYAKPNGERIYLISKALNISEAWLMGFDVPMQRNDKEINSETKSCFAPQTKQLVNTFEQLTDSGKEKVIDYTEMVYNSEQKDNN